MKRRLEAIRNLGIAARLGILTATVTALLVSVGTVAWIFQGALGAAAVGVAAGSCLAGAGLALVAARSLCEPSLVIANVVVGTALRMGIPLGIALAIHLRGGPLAEAGLLYYFLVFYPVTLGVETALTLPRSGGAAGRKREITDATP